MVDDLCRQVRSWCHLSNSALNRSAEAEALSLALGLSKFCREHVSRLIQSAARQNLPLMYAYMSDGWQGQVFRRHTVVGEDRRNLVRITRVRRHYALQRGLVKYRDVAGHVHSGMLFAEPRPLEHGARSPNFLSALIDFCEPLRFSTKGPIVEVFCFDGEMFSAMQTLISGRRNLMYEMSDALLAPRLITDDDLVMDVGLLKALHFQLFVKCTSHSLSNATKWGLSRWSGDDVNDNLYIAVSACISCSSDIIDCLPAFAENVLCEDPDWSRDEWDARQMLWNFLVSDPTMVDTIMQVNPRWDVASQRLRVSSWVATDPKGRETLLLVLHHFCTWVRFTITRWATVSTAARLWVGSLLVGLDGWMSLCRADPNVSGYNLNGFWRGKDTEVRTYAVMACFAGMVAEGAGGHSA
jgi:hypothetical protein